MAQSNVSQTKVVLAGTENHPWNNDYDESKNFHAMLFRPGYGVQARELTQLQTILQNQIERFGNHIFQNGSIVVGGGSSIRNARHINLAPTYAGTDVVAAEFLNKTITYTANSRVRALVIGTQEASGNDPPVLVIQYLSGRKFRLDDTIKVLGSEIYANTASANIDGGALVSSINDGIFFINGYFVKTPQQLCVVDAFSANTSKKIGLEFTAESIDEDQDASLLDPTLEASSYQAPGATRHKIELVLAPRELTSEDDEAFIELIRVEDGLIRKQVIYPLYSELGKELARRTNDESGSYTVRPFSVYFRDHPTDDTMFQAVLGSGKAYVQGWEYESIAQEFLDIPRARDYANVQNYDLYCTYGNYFIGANLTGVFDTTSFALADLHCVPTQYVSHNAANQYSSTRIGTTRVRAIEYENAANTLNSNTRTYRISLTDTEFTRIQTNANTTLALTANSVGLYYPNTGYLSGNTDAYRNATVAIRVGGTTYKYSCLSYNPTLRTITVDSDFTVTPTSASNVTIGFDWADAESMTISSLTAGGPSARANVNVATASKLNANTDSDAQLFESELDCLVFKFPQNYLKFGAMNDRDFMYRKKFSTTFSGFAATIAVDASEEAFTGNISSATSASILEHYLVIGSDQHNVRLNSVVVDGTQSATLTSHEYNGTATVFASVNLNAGNNTNPKRKTLITGNTTAVVMHPANTVVLGGQTALQNTVVYLVAGQVTITKPSRIPNEYMSLFVSDVKRITGIYDNPTLSQGAAISGTDIKSSFILDTGQRDGYYDHGRLALRPSAGRGYKGPLLIVFDYYDHVQGETDDGLGYFSVDSYPNANTTAGYADIDPYVRSDGESLELRDCVDFRPHRQNASNASPNFTLQYSRVPRPNEAFEADYSYYLPRRDQIVMTTDLSGPFKVLQGYSAIYPQEPRKIDNAMVLYKLFLPPYTEDFTSVTVRFIENKRYTMRDIGVLEQRIENLEYYQTLSMLEKASTDLLILDEFGLERTKYGILVDTFTGHGIGDVLNVDYKAGINKVTGALTPAKKRRELNLFNSANTNLKISHDVATLDYTQVNFISQPQATKGQNLQPYAFADYSGALYLDPSGTTWIDTKHAPDVIINNSGINDDFVADIDGTSNNTDENDAFENTTTVENTHFGTDITRNQSAVKSASTVTKPVPSRTASLSHHLNITRLTKHEN